MKDIQGVFWGCPRIEALFWPGLGGYVTALTGRALDWQSRGQRFDPAYLHQERPQRKLWSFFLLFETEVVSALKKLRSAHQLRQKFHEL